LFHPRCERKIRKNAPYLFNQPINDQYYCATKREQTRLNVTLFVNVFRILRVALPAHNGLVAGSSPAGPTNRIRHFSTVRFSHFLMPHSYLHGNSFLLFKFWMPVPRSATNCSHGGLQIVRMMMPIDLLQHLDAHA
jgi:hypothetical protein